MKIMMIHHFGQVGGGTNSCFDICRMLKEYGHDVTVVIPKPAENVKNIIDMIGVRLISAPVGIVRLSCHNADSGTIKELVKYLISVKYQGYWKTLFQREQPDLIMLNSSVQGPLACIAHQLGIKTICFIRETAREKGNVLWRKVNQKMLSKVDGLAFLTNYDIEAWGISTLGQQIVIPDIVDMGRLNVNVEVDSGHLVNENPEAKCVLYLGGLNREKGALELLHAFRICIEKNPNLYLMILGDASGAAFGKLSFAKRIFRSKAIKYFHTCKTMIEQINKGTDKILEIGLVSDVSPWYKYADAIIFPVKKVHQARPVYEAGLFRKPVILPDYPHFCDSVIDGYNGLIYRKNNIKDMADKILLMISDEERMCNMGDNNFEMYQNGHTYQKARTKLFELIAAVTNKSR